MGKKEVNLEDREDTTEGGTAASRYDREGGRALWLLLFFAFCCYISHTRPDPGWRTNTKDNITAAEFKKKGQKAEKAARKQ